MTKIKNKKKVFVAMSGGVDSSVSAYLLKEAGYDVTGVFMRCYNIDGCAERDAEDARRVAEKLDIPFYVFDFEESYKEKVVEYMVDGYKKGITPNPDVACNREIKFGLFLNHALRLGADYIATGHYVQIKEKDGVFSLFQGNDTNKDQSYFLWTLTQNDLKHCLFPVGKYKKPKVREIARYAELPVADKKDSQGICFLGEVSLVDFLSDYIPKRKGPIVDIDGNRLGDHEGSEFYTIGQRHGLDLAEKNKNLKIKGSTNTEPHYVVEKDVKTNTVVVAKKNDDNLFKDSVKLYDLNFISSLSSRGAKRRGDLVDNLKVKTRIRYRQPLFDALLKKDSKNNFTL
ncbi:MAG: tRNA 2-thiouridine(34) synthase MnmA, partial [Candidatus Paceibacterota bacterium]